jgi:hypothetical protein
MNDESGEQDPAGMSLYDVPSLNVIGAHLSIDIVKDEPDDALSEKEEGNVVSANGKVGLSFKSENGWVGSKPAKRLPLTVTVVALASIIGQPTTWAMVGSLVLDEPNKKKRVPKIRDSGRGKQFQGTKDVLQQKPAVSTSTVFTKRVVGLSKALRLGHLSSFIFHENLLVIASHGGVRVYDLHALLFNRELMVQSLMKARMQQKQSFGSSSSSHVGKSGNLAELASNPDNTEDSNAGEATDQIESDVPIPISMKDVDKLEKMRVCIGALGGMDPENRASTTFGRVNWEGSSIAIAKKYRKNIGTSKSELPDVFVSRAFPPCLIRIVLPPDNLQFENNFDDSASIDSD